jgi:predicted methyltransferase
MDGEPEGAGPPPAPKAVQVAASSSVMAKGEIDLRMGVPDVWLSVRQNEYPARWMRFLCSLEVSHNAAKEKLMKTILISALLALAAPALATAATPIEDAIASTERTDKDRERDAREKPAEVLAFAGVRPGMTVVDMFAGGGYYSELLAGVVGPTGKVLSVNNVPYAQYGKDAIKERFTEGRLKNVERRMVEASYINFPAKSVDLIVIVMSYHDAFWIDEKEGWPEINTDGFIESMKRMLKPGGKLLIVDHNAPAGTGKEVIAKTHRLNEDWAKKSLTSHGFVFEKAYDGLRNKDDQLDKLVFDPAVRGKTDRYVHLYRVK